MTHTMIEVELPADLAKFRLPAAVADRLQSLLDRQDSGTPLTAAERKEAKGLVDLAELLTLLRLRAERMGKPVEPAAMSADEWRRRIMETAGQWQGELERPEWDERAGT